MISISNIYTALDAAKAMLQCETHCIYIDLTGVNFTYFQGLLDAKAALKAQHPKTAFPLRGYKRRDTPLLVTMQHNNVPLNYMIVAPNRAATSAPAECYRIHLTTPDPEGEAI